MNVLVVGAGAQAKYILEIARARGDFEVVGLLDTMDNPTMVGRRLDGAAVLGGLDVLERHPPATGLAIMVAVADGGSKEALATDLHGRGYSFHTAIHPTAVVAHTAAVGTGVILNPLTVVQPFARVEDHAMVHAGCIVEHDCVVGRCANLAPGVRLAGWVRVGPRATVYTGACVIPQRTIGADAIVGAGAVVTEDVPAGTKVVGVPARPVGCG